MQYVHGHDCIHNLIDYSKIYCTNPYELLIESKTSCVYAIHSFTELRTDDYDLVCEDFGSQLERVEHPWNSLGVSELWNIAKQFSWHQHIAIVGEDDILTPNYIYTKWYDNIFKEHYTLEEWHSLMGVGPR